MKHSVGVLCAVLVVVAALGAIGGCLVANMTAQTDRALLGLVERFAEADRSSSVVSVGIVAASAILAAVAIPLITVLAVLRSERRSDSGRLFIEEACRNCRLPDSERMALNPDHNGIHGHSSENRPDRQLPSRTHRHRPNLRSEIPGHDLS